MLEIVLDKEKDFQAVKEVLWNGEKLPHVASVDISFREGGYPLVRVKMQVITVKFNDAEMLAEVQFVKDA